MEFRYTFFILISLIGITSNTFSQNICNPATTPDSSTYEGTAYFNYGSIARSKSQKYRSSASLGQTFVGYTESATYNTNLGFFSRYLLPPFALQVTATQGDLLDRIQLSWTVDGFGPSPNDGFNIYRDGIFLATVGANIRNYNDFNVIAGVAYEYTVRGLNSYGEGTPSIALGFQVPNGVVTGWIKTQSGSPVPDALVTLMPMQGYSAKFGNMDQAVASVPNTSSFTPVNNNWSMTFWIKTDIAATNAKVISIDKINLFVRAKNSASGHEGIEVATSMNGVAFLTADFADSIKNDWNHVTLSFDDAAGLLRIYNNGTLINQAPFNDTPLTSTGDVFLKMGNTDLTPGWAGRLDEVRIYNLLLSELDIPEIMHGTTSSQTPNLLYYWKMDEELGEKSYDLKNRVKLFFCGAVFDNDIPPVRTAGKTNADGYYRIESASYGTGTTFLAEPNKSFYLHKSVKFNRATSTNISIPNFPLPKKSTIELWVNSAGATGVQTIVSKKSTNNEFKVFLLASGINQELKVSLNGSTYSYGNLGDGFQHLAFTIDSTTNSLQVFKNGVSLGTHTFSGALGNLAESDSPWRIGVQDDGIMLNHYFNGLIDEFAVYDTILSQSKINNHFQATRNMQEKGLYVYYPMDEGAGAITSNVGAHLLTNGTLINHQWSAFAPNQIEEPHVFSPKTRQVSLNPSVTSVDQVDFTDRSTISVTGFIRYKNTDCYARNVEILVNNQSYNPRIFTDSTGKFTIDFDPGFTCTLKPVFEDHAFAPLTYQISNISSPIAGILFNDQTTRTVSGQMAGGLCKKPIIESNEFAYISLRSVDGCFEKLVAIDNQDGFFEIDNLPPIERMTVSVIHDNPFIDKFFNDKGNPTVDLSKKNADLEFLYFAQPQIQVISGLEPYSPTCNVIVMDQYEIKTLGIKLKEQYVVTSSDDGVCPIDTASFRIINGFGDVTVDTIMSGGILNYEFKVGKPNPTVPYEKFIQIISTTIEGNKGEYLRKGVVTGVFNKLPTFTTQLPETPTMVLHDPPGDGSYAFIEAGQKICQNMSFTTETASGGGVQTMFDGGIDLESIPFFGIPKVTFETVIGPDVTAINEARMISSNSMEICNTFSTRISTSEDDLIVGAQGGDVFIGNGLNINFGFADVILFDANNCEPYDSLAALVQPTGYGTTFIYTEWHIKNTVIPHLDTLKSLALNEQVIDTAAVNRYSASITRWNNILKSDSIRTAHADPIKNLSFSAGTSYEYSETIDTLESSSSSDGVKFEGNFDSYTLIKAQGIGGGVILKAHTEKATTNSKDKNNVNGITTGYVLKDDDILDAFSVDICIDSVYKTPLFKIKAGQSSCPWEPSTAKREGVNLVCTNGPVRTDVPANEPATFTFIMGNTSATLETFTYAFTAGPESNKYGAKIFCNGAPMNQIQWYAIPYGTSLPVTVTVERGSIEYDYDSLEIVLYSACEDQRANDLGILPDTAEFLYSAVYVSAFFIRPCSEVVINEPEQNFVVFPDPLTAGDDIIKKVVVSGYNDDPKFKSMSLQYRRSNGDGTWIAFPGVSEKYNPRWEGRGGIIGQYDTLSHKRYDFFDWNTLGFDDGYYELRAVTNCSGDASDKPGYSEIIKGKIDRSPPQLVGVPQPSDGVYHVGDEISFTFNQEINCQKFMQQQVGSASLKNTETNTTIGINRYCVDNKIVLVPNFINEEFENKVLKAELFNIEDLTGNKNTHVQWEFYVDRNELAWLEDSIEVVKYPDETKTITAKIHNRGGYPVPYSILSVPDWVHVSPDRGTLVANEIEEIHFTVDETVPLGWLSDSIILHTETGLNPFFMGGDEVLNLQSRVLCRPDKWVINPEGFNSSDYSYTMNFTLELNIEGVTSHDIQDIVGAYVDGKLRGTAQVKYNPSLNKYLAFLTVYSNQVSGETVNFQIWDASQCKLYAMTLETFVFNTDGIIGSPLVPQVIHTNNQLLRKIYIHPGWNWISFNLDLLQPQINGALSSLTNPDGAFIKSQTDFSAYSMLAQNWIGSLDSLSSLPMYQYNSVEYDSISMVGAFVNPSTAIPLHPGWNWIGYLPHQGLNIADALSSLSPSTGDIIKSQLTFAQYVNGVGWIGNLLYFNAPNGYLIKLANSDILHYPDPQNAQGNINSGTRNIAGVYANGKTIIETTDAEAMPYSYWKVDPTKFEHNMNVIAIVAHQDGMDNLLQEGDEVAAFVGNEVRGSSKAVFVPALHSYLLFMTIYSNEEGELLKFKFFNAAENKVVDIVENTGFIINKVWGGVDKPQALHLNTTTDTHEISSSDESINVYPNPFVSQLSIYYKSKLSEEITLQITDMYGSNVEEKILKVKSGNNVLEWKPKANIVGGAYLISIKSADQVFTRKVLYLR